MLIDEKVLLEKARKAMNKAYAPNSGIRVGAAIQSWSGEIHTGCNVENSSHGLTICAERVAVFNGVLAEGAPPTELNSVEKTGLLILAFAVVAEFDGKTMPISPCGACRQVLWEFSNEATVGLFASKSGRLIRTTMKKMLPYAFRLTTKR